MHRYELLIRVPNALVPEEVVETVTKALGLPVSALNDGIQSYDFYVKTPKPPFFSDISVYMETHSVYIALWRDAKLTRKDIETLDGLAAAVKERFQGTVTDQSKKDA